MERDKRVCCTGTSWFHLLGHKYTIYLAMCPDTKSPFYLDCLWVSFLVEKQTGLMSPLSLPPTPHHAGFQPQGRLIFLFSNQACLAVPRIVLILFPSDPTKAQLNCHFIWETFLFKTLVGTCQHPFLF